MKLSTTQEDLKAGLDIVKRSAASKSTLPVLTHVLLSAEDGLTLTCTDLERYLQRTVRAKIQEKGQALIPVSLLSEYVSSLPSDVVTLTTKNNDLKIQCGRFESTIKGLPSDEFPEIPSAEMTMELDGEALKSALAKTVYAASAEDARPTLMGVYFDGTNIAAADGFRMSVTRMPGDVKALVPARSIKELVRLLSGTVRIGTTTNNLVFEMQDTRLGTRLIDGTYPPYQRIIPALSGTEITVEVSPLLTALKSAATFARDNSNITRLHGKEGTLVVSSVSAEEGDCAAEIDAEISGEIQFALNIRYLTEMLNALGSEKVKFYVASASSPVLIKPVGDEDSLHVIMPMAAK